MKTNEQHAADAANAIARAWESFNALHAVGAIDVNVSMDAAGCFAVLRQALRDAGFETQVLRSDMVNGE